MPMHVNDMDPITPNAGRETNNNQNDKDNSDLEPSAKRPRIDLATIDPLKMDYKEMKRTLSDEQFKEFKWLLNHTPGKKQKQKPPRFLLQEYGERASLSMDIDSRMPLFLTDVQRLIMFSQMGPECPYSTARWCRLLRHAELRTSIVFIIENMSLFDYEANQSKFPFLNANYPNKVEILAPKQYNGDSVQELATVSLTVSQLRKYIGIHGDMDTASDRCSELFNFVKKVFPISAEMGSKEMTMTNKDQFPRTDILLSGWQMVEENFPLPIKGLWERKYKGYVLTKDTYSDVTPESPMFGLDCEMCRTTSGDLELTRVSVVDENYTTIYDQLVKPTNNITDYLTKYSGITAAMMAPVKKRLSDVQRDLRELLPPDAIIVGQSLNNDLHALKMMHPYIIDTSIIFNITGHRNRKTKLKTLSMEFLSEKIQDGHGHCSTEDSKASLKLAKLKLSKNIYFGDAVMSNIQTQVRPPSELGSASYATSMLKQAITGNRRAMVSATGELAHKYCYFTDKSDKLKKKRLTVKVACSNNEVVQMLGQGKVCDLRIGHIKLSGEELAADGGAAVAGVVDGWVQRLWERHGAPALHIVLFAGGQDTGNGVCFINVRQH